MAKNPSINKRAHEGSALIISLIVMGILLIVSIGVSDLIVGIIRSTRDLTEKTQAWYSAESGVEYALASVANHAPGFEEEIEGMLSDETKYNYKVEAVAAKIPNVELNDVPFEDDTYALLHLNESVTIPLFRGTGKDPLDQVKNFNVEYFAAPFLEKAGAKIDENLDILRWKIFGIDANGKMEVINEFLPVEANKNAANSPTCLGTRPGCWNSAQFYERDGTGIINTAENYLIKVFLERHTQNFLVLTNIINTDFIRRPLIGTTVLTNDEKKSLANIYYRVVEGEGEKRLTLPVIKITSDGVSGSTTQSLDVGVKRETFLPVFNYALYRTKE